MSLWKLGKHLKFRQIISLAILFAKHPLMLIPTIKGTKRCLQICSDLFPKKHRGNGRANAFRHALWNILIAREAMQWNKNEEKSLAWAKQITDWHEKFAPNPELAKAMDLHNNAMGRCLFATWHRTKKSVSDIAVTAQLKDVMAGSRKIKSLSDMDSHPQCLVHIEEE